MICLVLCLLLNSICTATEWLLRGVQGCFWVALWFWGVFRGFPVVDYSFSSVSCMLRNCSRASSRFSMISAARISGSGRFSSSCRDASLIHVMSRFALSRWMSSLYGWGLKRSVSVRWWRFSGL